MTDFDLLLTGGRVVLESGERRADVAIAGGIIAAVLDGDHRAAAREVIDLAGKVVLPGVVDPHTHVTLGPPDGWFTETRAAAIAGITTVLDFQLRSSSYAEAFPAIRGEADARVCVDYGMHFCPSVEPHLDELDRWVGELGVSSFKFYMNFRGEEGAYLIMTRLPLILAEGANAFRDRRISTLEPASIVVVEIRHSGKTWSLMRPPGEKDWSLPADTVAPGMKVKAELLEDLCTRFQRDLFRVVRYLPEERDLDARELTAARARWIVSLRESDGDASPQRFYIGRPVDGSRPLEYYARVDRDGVPVFTLEQDLPDLLARIHAHLQAITVR